MTVQPKKHPRKTPEKAPDRARRPPVRELQAKLARTLTTSWPTDSVGVIQALDCLDHGIAIWSADLTLQYWNRRYAEFYIGEPGTLYVGKPLPELLRDIAEQGGLGDGDIDRLVEERLEEFLGNERLFTRVSEPVEREIEVRRQSLPDGGHVVTLSDVTERRRTERALQRQAVVMEQLREAVIVTGSDRRIIEINPAAADMLGYAREELIGQTPDLYTSDPEAWKRGLPSVLKTVREDGVWKGEVMLRRKGGGDFLSELILAPLRDDDGQPVATIAIHRDITEERRIEKELQRQAVVMEQLREAVIVTDIDRRIIELNPAAAEMLGYSREELIGQTPDLYILDPEDWNRRRPAIFREIMETGIWTGELELRRKDGSELVSELVLTPMRDDTGEQIAAIAMFRDITEQRRIEKELQRQAVVMEQLNEAVVISDLERRITDANRAAERLFGYARDELIGQTTNILPADPASWEETAPKVLARLRRGNSWNGETVMKRKDGSEFLADLALAPLCDPDGSPVATIAIIRDVTSRRQAEEALRASEHKFFMLFETIRDGIVLTNNDGVIENANQAFLDMVGYTRSELIGQGTRHLMPPRYYEQRDETIRKAQETGQMVTVEKEYLRKDGTTFPAIANLAVIFDDDGTPIWRTTIIRDITEQKEREREQKRLMAILEATTDFIGIITREGRLAYVNQAGRQMLGLELDEDISHLSIWDFHSDECARLIRSEGLPAVEREGAWRGEASLVNRVGEEIPVSQLIVAHRGHDGEIEYYSSMARDISDRVAFEAELMEAKERAELANRAKSDFLANMSHELRTPLNAIIGFSKMMKDQLFGELGAPQYVEYVRDIHDSGTHLLGIINDILDLSKIEAGRYELSEQEVDLAAAVTWCINTIRPRLHSEQQKLTLRLPEHLPHLWADERALRQILLNLLSNSVKFTPESGEITVDVTQEPDGSITLRVIDTGVGIPEDKIEEVLRPFGQADSTLARQFGGTGLGLSITKSLLEMHGADLKLTSTVGEGTTATIRFPAERCID